VNEKMKERVKKLRKDVQAAMEKYAKVGVK
jgi:hypothetical protein